jgi:hypothetical protein
MRIYIPFLVIRVSSTTTVETSSEEREYVPIHRYVEPVSVNLTDWETQMLTAQQLEDEENDMYTPRMEVPDASLEEYTRVGMLELGEIIHAGYESVIFATSNRPELLVKYQANCDELADGKKPIHPLVYDYWMMREAFMLGLAPEPIFLSPAALLIDILSTMSDQKLLFKMDSGDFIECVADEGAVRYMVMRKSEGVNLFAYRSHFLGRILPMGHAAQITIRVIQAIEMLHEDAGIVHGDIHSGNILIVQDGATDSYSVLLIDFGRARRVDRNLTNDRVNPIGKWFHQLCSPWQIDGRAWGRRDDIHKAVHSFATVINPMEYATRENALLQMSGLQTAIRYKRNACMFVMAPSVTIDGEPYASKFHPVLAATRHNPDRMHNVTNALYSIQAKVTAYLDDINADIAYGEIAQHFRNIIDLVR